MLSLVVVVNKNYSLFFFTHYTDDKTRNRWRIEWLRIWNSMSLVWQCMACFGIFFVHSFSLLRAPCNRNEHHVEFVKVLDSFASAYLCEFSNKSGKLLFWMKVNPVFFSSSLHNMLYIMCAFTTAMSNIRVKMGQYHFLVLMFVGYLLTHQSCLSTPPMYAL